MVLVHSNSATKAHHVASKLPSASQSIAANPTSHSKHLQKSTDKENLVSCSLHVNCGAPSIQAKITAADAAASATKIAGEARQQTELLVRFMEEQRARLAAHQTKTEPVCKVICWLGEEEICDIRSQLPTARRWPSTKSASLARKEHDRDGTWDTDFPKTPRCARARMCRQSRSSFIN